MAKEYGNRRSSRSRGGVSHQFLLMTVTFLLGYMTASLFDIETISHWVNTQVLAHREIKQESIKTATQQTTIPPKPKFEFYTLLADEKVPSSQTNTGTQNTTASNPTTTAVAVTSGLTKPNAPKQPLPTKIEAPKSVTTAAKKGESYLVQVASFKARQDAEQMKGNLILKGFSVYIIPISHPTKGIWYRVVVGPYTNRGLAQQAQITLARNERLNGMITTGG